MRMYSAPERDLREFLGFLATLGLLLATMFLGAQL